MEKDFGKGLISLDIKDKDDCPIFDPFGMCTVTDCLTCDNCEYLVILASGEVLKNFVKDDCEDKYLIEFFDEITGDVVEYLLDNTNDYRITRISDGVILRYSNDDLIARGYEPRKKMKNVIEKEESKSFVKRMINRFNYKKASN